MDKFRGFEIYSSFGKPHCTRYNDSVTLIYVKFRSELSDYNFKTLTKIIAVKLAEKLF